jgi:hypothetical protein
METVAKYNNLVNQHPKHMTLIHSVSPNSIILSFSIKRKPVFEYIFTSLEETQAKPFSSLADKDIAFAKKIAKKIKCKALKKLAHSIIEDFEFSYQLEKMKNNGTEIIQL